MDRNDIKNSFLNTWNSEAEEINRLHDYVDEDLLCDLVEKIAACKGKVVLTGCGTSAAVAKKIVHSLSVISIPAVFLVPSDAVHGSLGLINEDDIVIFISKGGNTKELCSFIDNVKAKKAFVVTVSENEGSQLAQKADMFIKVKIEREPDEFNMLATASSVAVIALFDALCIALMKYKGFSKDSFALNHPQGAVGERLLKHLD